MLWHPSQHIFALISLSEIQGGADNELVAYLPSLSVMVRNVEVYKKLYEAVGLGFVWKAAELPVVGGLVNWCVLRRFVGSCMMLRLIMILKVIQAAMRLIHDVASQESCRPICP